ncbi:hypothetical protein D9M71_825080 [compost metagenome]
MGQLQLVAVDLLVVPLAIAAGASDGAVVGVVAIHLEIAVIALAVVVVEGITQLGVVVEAIVGDRAQPPGALLVATVFDVVVVETVVLVDVQGTDQWLQYG